MIGKHALRNVLLPVITVLGYDLGGMLGGAVITETVFSMNGLGRTMINAVNNLDLPMLLGATLFAALMIVLANLIVDILYQFIDPRTEL